MSDTASVIFFTIRVALLSTLLLAPFSIATAWLLARLEFRGKSIVETLITLPLVVPPVATGLILLKLLGRRGPLGRLFDAAGFEIVFTWRAVVIAMMVMSFPLFVRTARVAFEGVDRRIEGVARTLGATPARVFFRISLPLALPGVLGGAILAFARALGEFGATILVAGNIPGETTTLSVAIYSLVQLAQDRDAYALLLASVAIAFAAVWGSEFFLRRQQRPRIG